MLCQCFVKGKSRLCQGVRGFIAKPSHRITGLAYRWHRLCLYRRKSPIRRNKIYGGFKSFNFNNLRAIRRIRRIRRKYGGLNFGFIRCNWVCWCQFVNVWVRSNALVVCLLFYWLLVLSKRSIETTASIWFWETE
jgi:hypothetical protein